MPAIRNKHRDHISAERNNQPQDKPCAELHLGVRYAAHIVTAAVGTGNVVAGRGFVFVYLLLIHKKLSSYCLS